MVKNEEREVVRSNIGIGDQKVQASKCKNCTKIYCTTGEIYICIYIYNTYIIDN